MTAVERLSGDAARAADPWDVTPKPALAGACPGCGNAPDEPATDGHGGVCVDRFHATPEPYDEETAHAAALRLVETVEVLETLAPALDRDVPGATAFWREQARVWPVVGVVDRIRNARRELARIESLLEREAGQQVKGGLVEREGLLPDGRRFEVLRGKDRKAWAHDDWQRDVRRQVLSGVGEEVVDTTTGEPVDVPALLAAVEEAHGAGPPRVGVLKRLGLRPDDYSETVPGPWSVRVYGETGADDA